MDAAEVLDKIKRYQKRVHDTDVRIRQYLSDRTRYPHPLHEELIEEIRNYERVVEHRLRAFRNSEIEMRLDNLLYSLMVHERAWKKQFQDASHGAADVMAADRASARNETHRNQMRSEAPEAQKLFEKIYELSKHKWDQYGVDAGETKEELARRLIPQYQKIRKDLKQGKKLRVIYDKTSHRVRLKAGED